jgi:hypothetical protein
MTKDEDSDSRGDKFLTEYARLMLKIAGQRAGKTPDEVAALDSANERRAAAHREMIWIHWLKVSTWTVKQAVLLVFGRDPNNPFIGHERYSKAELKHHQTARDRLASLADTQLVPTSRNSAAAELRYSPGGLLLLAAQEGWGFSKALAELAERRGAIVSASSALSIPQRRAQLVYEFSCELEGLDPKMNKGDISLKMTVAEFQSQLKHSYGSTHKDLVSCGSKALEAARLHRTEFPGIPKVRLRSGRPEVGETSSPPRRLTRKS